MISVSETGEAAIWDPVTGRVSAELAGNCQRCYPRISDDGSFVAIGSKAGVTIWNGKTRVLTTGPADRIAITPNGELIAVAHGPTVSTWRVATGERLWTASIEMPAAQLGWSGDALVVASVDMTARIVTVDRQIQIQQSDPVFTFAIGPRGTIATMSDSKVELWDRLGAHLRSIDPHGFVTSLAFSSDEQQILIGDGQGNVQFFSPHGRERDLAAHTGTIRGLAISQDGTLLATVSNDQSIKLWRLPDLQLRATLLGTNYNYTLAAPVFNMANTRLVAATARDVRAFATTNPDAATTVITDAIPLIARFITGQRFATITQEAVQLWSVETGTELAHIAQPAESRRTISPDGHWVATYMYPPEGIPTGNNDVPLEIYDVVAHTVTQRIPGPGADFPSFSPDGTKLAVAGQDHSVDIWATNGARLARLQGHTADVVMASFGAHDRVVSVARDRTIRLWSLATGQLLALTATMSDQKYTSLSSSSQRVISIETRVVHLYDAATLVPIGTFEHEGKVAAADLSPDNQLLASATTDGSVELRDLMTGALIATFRHGSTALAVTFSEDGTRLLSAGADKTATIWRVDRETRPASVVAAFVRCHAPYRLVETRLEPAEPACN